MFSIQQEDLLSALQQLKQALYNHEQWHKDLSRSIICHLPYDPDDLQEDAHRQCRFGQWYYSTAVQLFRENSALSAMELEHKHMHALAARLLQDYEQAGSVAGDDYDLFADALDKFRLQLQSLISEVEDALYKRDPLTGAESRIGMLGLLRQLQALVARNIQACSIVIMDLDHFKNINDSFGHVIGDRVLAGVARYVKTGLRPYDRLFRYGGEEFLIALPNTDLYTAQIIMDRIRGGLATEELAHEGKTPIMLTASFGIAPIESKANVEDSIDHADQALYAAKQAGRNRVEVWKH